MAKWKDPNKELPKNGEHVLLLHSRYGRVEIGYFDKEQNIFTVDGEEYYHEYKVWEVKAWTKFPKYDLED